MPLTLPESPVIPLWLKVGLTLFVLVLVPVYWRQYGPGNFLWFSDIALFLLVPALWWESRLLASVCAVMVLVPETAWVLDFAAGVTTGRHPVGIARYMFENDRPLYLRGLSLFHLALPPLLIYLVARLGYDGRALPVQVAIAWVVLPVTWWLTEPRHNINWVYGFGGGGPQEWMPSWAWLMVLMAGFPLVIYLPTHLALGWLFGEGGT